MQSDVPSGNHTRICAYLCEHFVHGFIWLPQSLTIGNTSFSDELLTNCELALMKQVFCYHLQAEPIRSDVNVSDHGREMKSTQAPD